ncbi:MULTISPECIES: hypothetical protein [Mycolicibacter]|uniref:Uncharacterized protein n=1 Tax=Mycolicibacter longobardus TaxID=1108812 RepID=A0A1X1YBF9_9MYCO|nr:MULTISPECIES: hypothetical protein [Mycolicibacter]ORW08452.1 hypothetical protein AWC16_18805 [Mycolicibacter longobardus]RAV04437.1 hypothetical protein DQP56_01060 [Mycolicibacter senuensis]
MRLYAVQSNGTVSSFAYDPHHCLKIAQQLRDTGQNASVVHTDTAGAGSDPYSQNVVWASAEACELGHSRGWDCANYANAYQGATRETEVVCDVPDRFSGFDAEDYRVAFAAGVSDFWDADDAA